jgi:hypothetical protein
MKIAKIAELPPQQAKKPGLPDWIKAKAPSLAVFFV